MRYAEIIAPTTHPYIAVLAINPEDFYRLECLTDERPEVRLLHLDKSVRDEWTVRFGCASSEVADRLEEAWN